jgi:DNA-binding protein Alba
MAEANDNTVFIGRKPTIIQNLKVKDIQISTVSLKSEDGRSVNVSSIEIYLSR